MSKGASKILQKEEDRRTEWEREKEKWGKRKGNVRRECKKKRGAHVDRIDTPVAVFYFENKIKISFYFDKILSLLTLIFYHEILYSF